MERNRPQNDENNLDNEDKVERITPTTSIQHCTTGSSQCNKAKRNKRCPVWKGKSKTIFVDNMIFYVGNLICSIKQSHQNKSVVQEG